MFSLSISSYFVSVEHQYPGPSRTLEHLASPGAGLHITQLHSAVTADINTAETGRRQIKDVHYMKT